MKLILFTFLILSSTFAGQHNGVLKQRIKEQLNILQDNLNYDFKANYQVILISKDTVANAAASFPFIIVNENWMKDFSDMEILAVLAHEVAHLEHAHLAKGLTLIAGGFINAVFDYNNSNSLRERFSGFVQYYKLKQELFADCIAYNWLDELNRIGIEADPDSLNSVVRRDLPGIDDFDEEYMADDFVYTRYARVRDGHPKECVEGL